MPFQPGHKLAKGGRKDKPFRTALMLELKAAGEDMPELRQVARGLIERAKAQDPAAKELIDRLDGKVSQPVVGDNEDDPINIAIQEVRYTIVDPRHQCGESVSPAAETSEV